ncbi:MAG: ParB/RepB/Spo0J family partition protein [Bacteroidales bacterium]|nr:ParB/RepB/Spo0J family partition protein [Bacteroidales bacterium]MBQ6709418.1 ParB/RepB/Spo0J family partition protein [Bacteroidales bacterium]
MAKQQRGLGKGIGALLGGENEFAPFRQPVGYVNKEVVGQRPSQDTSDILRIPVDMIEPNPYQPRMNFDQEALEELADSIRTLGLIQPITVRRTSENRYQIISGERRFRACRQAGMDMIPAYIRDTNDQGMLEMAIVENIQRENLDPIEVAMSYQRLIEECNLTQEQMAVRVGKKRASVTNYLRLLKLPAKIQHDLKVGLLSVGHAKVLLGIEDLKLQEYLCDLVIREDLSVRQLEDKIKKLTEQKKAEPQEEQDLPDEYFKVLEIVGKYFENNISLKRSGNGKGSMTIHFGSDDEVRRFLKALEDSNF